MKRIFKSCHKNKCRRKSFANYFKSFTFAAFLECLFCERIREEYFHLKEGVCNSYGIHVVELSSGMIIYMQNVSPTFKESKRSRYEAVRDFN